jgi:hypothetical protein
VWNIFGREICNIELDGTPLNHSGTKNLSRAVAVSAHMEVIASESEYPRMRENFAPSLSIYIINCEEETMSPHNKSDMATVNVSSSPMMFCLPPSRNNARDLVSTIRPNHEIISPTLETSTAPKPAPAAKLKLASVKRK